MTQGLTLGVKGLKLEPHCMTRGLTLRVKLKVSMAGGLIMEAKESKRRAGMKG